MVTSCTNNKNQKIDISKDSDSSQINYSENNKEKNNTTLPKIYKEESDSLRNDVYQFKNDTLVQVVYINYLTPRKIKFLVMTQNKISSHECEYSGSAFMADNEGTAQGIDELNEDELYGVYEYFTKGSPYFTINVEFKRGKRMTVFIKDDKDLCEADCPLTSQGTLRRISLSKSVQHNPTW